MNKELILEAFFKHRDTHEQVLYLIKTNSKLFTKPVLQPSNFEQEFSKSSSSSEKTRPRAESKNNSFCSEYSQLTLNKASFDEILNNRKDHKVFAILSETEPDSKTWRFKDKNEIVKGPFTGQQMDDLFQLKTLDIGTLIQHKSQSDEYLLLNSYVKRYYKKLAAVNAKPMHHKPIHNKDAGDHSKHRLSMVEPKEVNEIVTRDKRTLSHAVQPNLYFLNNIEEEQESDDEIPVTRLRSHTANNR